jgi:hypothetical protein
MKKARPTRKAAGFIRRGQALVFSSGGIGHLSNQTVNSILMRQRERTKPDA